MDAFAMPAFYDGQVRLNLVGRERHGRVAVSDFQRTCESVVEAVQACVDPRTGESPLNSYAIAEGAPGARDPSAADVSFEWRSGVEALWHPELGMIGPVPTRRTGGHTGGRGVAFLAAQGVRAGKHPQRSAFDVVPTLIDFLVTRGLSAPATTSFSGESFLREVSG